VWNKRVGGTTYGDRGYGWESVSTTVKGGRGETNDGVNELTGAASGGGGGGGKKKKLQWKRGFP